jgi:sugar O-acyltransferase (sialic acid O-acetyltransferase NeuD family)
MKLFGIYGASGFGAEVMPLAKKEALKEPDAKVVFIDDGKSGSKVVNFDEFLTIKATEKKVCIAVAKASVRQQLFLKLEENKISHWSLFSEQSVIMDNCQVGENSVLAPFVTLTSNIKIGKSFHANLYSYVAHDCILGDFVTFAPGVKCNGNVHIGDKVYVGAGAIIKNGKPGNPLVIGDNALIGMGAVVAKSVPPGTMVVANPSKALERKIAGF